MKITALIVTYNRVALLQETLAAVLKQTISLDEIVIFDNASTDNTSAWLKSLHILYPNDKITIIKSTVNTGGAGGFNEGMKYAYEHGSDWIWMMDDDCVPNPNALERILTSPMFLQNDHHPTVGYFASAVDWINGERCRMNIPAPAWEWNWYHRDYSGCYRINSASFVSILVNTKAVQKVGYPVKEFFIWFDDWEYTTRITREFPAFYVADSIVTHKTADNLAVNWACIKQENIFKYKYGFRNEVSLIFAERFGFLKSLMLIIPRLILIWRTSKSIKITGLMFVWALKGLFFNYKQYIEYPSEFK